ncbi:MAG: iron-containing alcohol dehydrogenase [Gemmataceae bacterium]|nr:iron-containing alcohol dehydrogenase [Gemmataceae bacterium]
MSAAKLSEGRATFNVPPTVLVGAGASQEAATQVKRLGAERVLLVTDTFLEQTGLAARLGGQLEQAGIGVRVFSGVQPDPTVANVGAGLRAFREARADCLVALGGGSPIDAAKAIGILTQNPEPLGQYAGYHRVPRRGAPVIAIPTTAGTGSEATKVAVITDTERGVKMMILDQHLLPAAALVDYELSMSMPPALTAHVGIDTLTHGIEAYVSRKANALTDPLALSCIELCARHLTTAYREPDNRAARAGMALAACQGGMAFANSSVCLVHGMSRPIGAYFHLPHGLSNAVLLPAVTRFSLDGATERYAAIARVMGLAGAGDSATAAARQLADGLAALNAQLAVPALRDCQGMERARFEQLLARMAEDALASGSPQNNPLVPTPAQIRELYLAAW